MATRVYNLEVQGSQLRTKGIIDIIVIIIIMKLGAPFLGLAKSIYYV